MKLKDSLGLILVIFTLISVTVGGLTYFAKASELKLVAMRLEQKITNDAVRDNSRQIRDTNMQILELEMYYSNIPCSQWKERDRKIYLWLKGQLEELKTEKNLLKKED